MFLFTYLPSTGDSLDMLMKILYIKEPFNMEETKKINHNGQKYQDRCIFSDHVLFMNM